MALRKREVTFFNLLQKEGVPSEKGGDQPWRKLCLYQFSFTYFYLVIVVYLYYQEHRKKRINHEATIRDHLQNLLKANPNF